ncbi:MAG: alpha/beta fold hydrolase [Proteobacteria bacterium]|nr:alpha/beta fold hydrolase [Pseudomonadota bacterium]MBU1688970.1 alpha/beta fold hydrolase [Pseudomonadota bacterium]
MTKPGNPLGGSIRVVLTIIIVAILTSCTSPPQRLTPSGLNSHYNITSTLPFPDYIDACRQMLIKARYEENSEEKGQAIEANLPFELRPDQNSERNSSTGKYENGILLIHGLSDSPYEMKPLAQYFQARGFLVRTILLPGHGSRPGDLLKVTAEDWQRSCTYGITGIASQVDHVYLGGFSTGGALAVDYALRHPEEITGLYLFAPALKIKTVYAPLSLPVKTFKDWLSIHDDRDYARYESFSVNGAAQVYRLTQKINHLVRREGKVLEMPVRIVLSLEDIVIDSRHTVETFQQWMVNPENQILLYTRAPLPPEFTDSRIMVTPPPPQSGILDYSHLSLLLPPTDPHYGINGNYRNCLHYRPESPQATSCLAGKADWLGEVSQTNLTRGIVQRMTFNPSFTDMLSFLNH